jgi:hypothetical protein
MQPVIIGSVSEQIYEPAKDIQITTVFEQKDPNVPQIFKTFIRENEYIMSLDQVEFCGLSIMHDGSGYADDDLFLSIDYRTVEHLPIPKNGRIEISAL